jgi:cytoskeletal protein CcmA (bactofilin family)
MLSYVQSITKKYTRMEPDKNTNTSTEDEKPKEGQEAPADALSRTPDDLEQEQEKQTAADSSAAAQPAGKKDSAIKRFFRKVNVYFLIFGLLVVIGGAVAIVGYLNSQKPTAETSVASQQLTSEALKQLANNDVSVGSNSQTLSIQGNAIIQGQTLMRGDLNVAGNFQTGGSLQAPSITISGQSNLGTAQINSLQVATDTAVQGSTTLRDLNVAGAASFGGAITASQITVTNLVLSGNATLQVPNHISFAGPSPGHSINPTVLGSGGSASVNGSDTAGSVNVNTGSGTTTGCFVRINFNQNFTSQPRVIISPVGAAAGQTQYYVDRNNSGFSICASSPAPGNQAFAFDYFVTN